MAMLRYIKLNEIDKYINAYSEINYAVVQS